MLKELLTTNLLSAFQNELKDAYAPFTLRRTSSIRDKLTDTDTITVTSYPSNGVFGKFNKEEVDGTSIQYTDVRLLILQDTIEIKPKIGDIVDQFSVASVSEDPAKVTWVLGLRATNGVE